MTSLPVLVQAKLGPAATLHFAATTLADSGLSGASSFAAATIYVVVGSASVAGPVAWFLIAPRQAAGPLDALKEFMETHNPAIMATVLLILGTKLATSGLATLTN